MDPATADALMKIAEASRAGVRRHEAEATLTVEDRYGDMTQALGWQLDADDVDSACRLASALVPFWMSTNRIHEGDDWFGRILSPPREANARLARALYDHGYLVFWAGRYDLASERFAKSREVATALGDRSLEALALAGLARVALNTDVEAAVRLLNEALSLTEGSPDDNEGRSSTLHVLGVALQMSGDLEGARGVISRWLASAEQSGDSFVIWTESANLSMVERQLGNLDRAEDLSIQVVMSAIAQSSELFFAWALNGLAAVTAAKGELTRAGTIIGIASAMLNRANGDWPPDEREQYEETIAVLERGLRPEQLDVARSEGANMTKADALEYVQAKRSTG